MFVTTRATILTQISLSFHGRMQQVFFTNGNAALTASDYDRAINLYLVVINLEYTSNVVFALCSEAKLSKMIWEDAILDAQKVIRLNPLSHIGYQLTHTVLHGTKCYDGAIHTFTIILSKLTKTPKAQIQDLHQQYVCPFQAEDAIQKAVWNELKYALLCLLNTSMGLLCN
ncbi:hypothetical protein BDR07DRAFT_1477243 [Suillus spraguei]|nr:hypothetical protein BDR07DRAFT_1477243 [Suillus spraguei]